MHPAPQHGLLRVHSVGDNHAHLEPRRSRMDDRSIVVRYVDGSGELTDAFVSSLEVAAKYTNQDGSPAWVRTVEQYIIDEEG